LGMVSLQYNNVVVIVITVDLSLDSFK